MVSDTFKETERYAPGVDSTGWQPIATAPLDGRRLRLKIEGERGKDGQPPTGIGRPSEDFWDEGGWVMENREIWRKPTHWAALDDQAAEEKQ